MHKVLFFLGCAGFFSLLYTLGLARIGVHRVNTNDGNTHVFFCDVGQGDGILITHEQYQLVIDGGPDEKILSCLSTYMPKDDRTIEALFATHADSDHISGLVQVLSKYQVKHIYAEAYGKPTQTWERFRAAVLAEQKEGAVLHFPIAGEEIVFDSLLSAKIINPLAKRGADEVFSTTTSETQLSALYSQEAHEFGSTNNESIALILSIRHITVAMMADVEIPGELALLQRKLLQDVDVLKVAHHGSKSGTSMDFLSKIQPEAVVLSVGQKNQYMHPSPEVIERFQHIGLPIFRTDQMGTVEMISDGERYWWQKHPQTRSK